MGRFADDMGRLRDDIEAQRAARQSLIADTRQEITDAARAFISDLKTGVQSLQTEFREAHADMAATARADRNAFLTQLGHAVADLQSKTVSLVTDFASERSAGRQAWRGTPARATTPPARTHAAAEPLTPVLQAWNLAFAPRKSTVRPTRLPGLDQAWTPRRPGDESIPR